jgi:hypothetical protein
MSISSDFSVSSTGDIRYTGAVHGVKDNYSRG